jgi:hypothetical protein
MTTSDAAPRGTGSSGTGSSGTGSGGVAPSGPGGEREPADREPILPEQSPEDTDAAWGEYPEPADDRLYRDRPPHWADY